MVELTHSVVAVPAAATSESGRRRLLAALLLAALAGAACAQGAFYPRGQAWLAALLVLAAGLAMAVQPIRLARPTVLMLLALAGWPVLAGALHAQFATGLRLGLLVVAIPLTIGCARRLAGSSVQLLLDGLVALGALLALLGCYGALRHRTPLAIPGQGMYRAASTLTYPNAAGALLAMLALLGIGMTVTQPATRRWNGRGALLSIVLAGLAATLSRGGLLAFAGGLLVLAVGLPGLAPGLGVRRVLAGLAWPLAGAAVGALALLPSMPATATGRPALAVGGLLLCAAIGSVPAQASRPARWLPPYCLLGVGASAIGVLRPFPSVTRSRLSLDSPDRWAAWQAAWHVFRTHPLAGAGPGLRSLSWQSSDGTRIFSYAHNEYLQVLATLGLLGLALLLTGLAALGLGLRRAGRAGQPAGLAPAAVAVTAALLISMALDFTGHFPALVLTAAAVAGCAVPVRPARP